MRSQSPHYLAIAFSLVAVMLTVSAQAARPAPIAGKDPAPTSQYSQQAAIPAETLRTTLQNLQKTASDAEAKNTPAGQAAALEQYRKMRQMLDRFPYLKVEAGYKDSLARKIEDLQAKVTENARQAAARERAERAARSAREKAVTYASGGGAACPPGMVRTGST
jgi:hypothetical protein